MLLSTSDASSKWCAKHSKRTWSSCWVRRVSSDGLAKNRYWTALQMAGRCCSASGMRGTPCWLDAGSPETPCSLDCSAKGKSGRPLFPGAGTKAFGANLGRYGKAGDLTRPSIFPMVLWTPSTLGALLHVGANLIWAGGGSLGGVGPAFAGCCIWQKGMLSIGEKHHRTTYYLICSRTGLYLCAQNGPIVHGCGGLTSWATPRLP